MQIITTSDLPDLATLLEHPDFVSGLRDGEQAFQEYIFPDDHHKDWTETDIIDFTAQELSPIHYYREVRIDRAEGHPSHSFLHHLGFVISYLDQALAARAQAMQAL